MTNYTIHSKFNIVKIESLFLLFRVVEVHRTDETTATPYEEGAHLSEQILSEGRSNNKRI